MDPVGPLRLYRGLSRPYRPEVGVHQGALVGTDFTDCPGTALQYARGPRGVLLVLDVPAASRRRVSEEFWPDMPVRRLMVWGRFDDFIVAVIAAKELRAVLRRVGVGARSEAVRSTLLEAAIAGRIGAAGASPDSIASAPR